MDEGQAAESRRSPDREASPPVLVIEDDRMLQDAIVETLREEGIGCHGIPDAWEAVDWIAEHEPRIVILDMMMPRMNGWEFLEHRRRDPKLSKIPVLVVTAAAQARLENMPGVERVLMKPVDGHTLIEAVKKYL